MTTPQFPPISSTMQQATFSQLIRQGLWLHYASLAGPLRTSPRFRKENPNWVPLVMTRWWKEYGLNMLVFLALQPLIFMYAPHTLTAIAAWELAAATLLPCLTVLQMLVDSIKPDVRVDYDR